LFAGQIVSMELVFLQVKQHLITLLSKPSFMYLSSWAEHG